MLNHILRKFINIKLRLQILIHIIFFRLWIWHLLITILFILILPHFPFALWPTFLQLLLLLFFLFHIFFLLLDVLTKVLNISIELPLKVFKRWFGVLNSWPIQDHNSILSNCWIIEIRTFGTHYSEWMIT